MPNDPTRVEIITGRERSRRYTANEKLALVDATMLPGMTVSAVADRVPTMLRDLTISAYGTPAPYPKGVSRPPTSLTKSA